MKKKIKVCIVTGSRADYGILSNLIKAFKKDRHFNLKIIATGMHLSPLYGNTYKEIEEDGLKIDSKIKIIDKTNTQVSVSQSVGRGIDKFTTELKRLSPDIVLILGDRFETLSSAIPSMFLDIPIAHIHGGEVTEGAFDDSIRHSLTKMSHLHFAATEKYKKRIIQMGENPDNVFNVGSLSIDNIKNTKILNRKTFFNCIGLVPKKKNYLVTFHPLTKNNNVTSVSQFKNVLSALDRLTETNLIFTKANSDPNGLKINNMIKQFVKKNNKSRIAFDSMGYKLYFSALKNVDCVIGNSSSGIIEAPSFKIPTINIGNRQKGREMARSIINCKPLRDEILFSIKKSSDQAFQKVVKSASNPYGSGKTTQKILKIIKNIDLNKIKFKKFFDLS